MVIYKFYIDCIGTCRTTPISRKNSYDDKIKNLSLIIIVPIYEPNNIDTISF